MFHNLAHRGHIGCGCAAAVLLAPKASHPWAQTEVTPAAPSSMMVSADGSWSYNWKWHDAGRIRAPRWPGPATKPAEKSFTRSEVAAADGTGPDGKILVTYRDGVYDVTEYVNEHPGGKFILSAAGGPVDSWWAYWMQHHVSPVVAETLERLRAGKLSDYISADDEEQRGGGLWADEQALPSRASNRSSTKALVEMPYTSVTTCASLARSYLTETDALYVRNHAPVPSIPPEDADDHAVAFCVDDDELASLSLKDLRHRFRMVQVTSVLQCAGNRASDNISCNGFQKSGFSGSDDEFIGLGMLGNARWGGVRLADVLNNIIAESGRDPRNRDGLHVTFEGLDGYYSSTPLAHVMDNAKDCLLALEVNGAPLSPDHGYPIRVVLPGVAGARQVKWLSKISIGPESASPWVRHFYRDKPSMAPIQQLPMNSVILSPEPGDIVAAGQTVVQIRGVAYSGGTDRDIARVEVSADRGQCWYEAKLLWSEVEDDDSSRVRGWIRWEAALHLAHAHELGCGGPLAEVWCRAFDETGVAQPERSEAHGGYMYNGYHKVPVVRR